MSKILQVENLVQEFNLTKDFLDKVKFKNGHFSLENRVVHAVNNVSFDVEEGEVFSHVVEAGGLYQPQYEVQGQPGAVYDITALEDIVTPDGVVHAKAGELVATLTTGSDGTATSEPLYLGRYQVSERTAPAGMVLDSEPKEVTLAYAGQEVSVTTADVGFVNERQKVEISLKKLLEQDETFSIGMDEEWKNITFGLFAAEEIVDRKSVV